MAVIAEKFDLTDISLDIRQVRAEEKRKLRNKHTYSKIT